MRSPEARAREVADRLAAATGTEARTLATPEAIRVEVYVPDEIPEPLHTALVDALRRADRYGHARTADAAVAWAEITRTGRGDVPGEEHDHPPQPQEGTP
ncbi:hypothetical protein [Streptomyces sp. ICBB 8177]|uniref:hypothetical protein n=1 Tax=Streptomyces sp. ICBB 8177 TaxID=563922 RepID=UPI000D6729A5|nr:hypothetical protein [Streptomyces sp. ICBB 8177]PWI41061.1 hypothetical protein CK485_27220 [Streptomyces sp. ICBB 8177]